MTGSQGTAEHARLADSPGQDDPWRQWGPYLSNRQWGTVREDYSADGNAWEAFPFDHAHARAYRWGEDGLAGLCDRYGFLNLAVAVWNGRDDRLKERLFGLTNGEGNHGEDVKEYWWPLDATPTHSWARWLYRYPQAAFPYQQLRHENAARGRDADEYELTDTGVLDENRFFDVTVTHAKASPTDICVLVEATNQGPDPAPLHLLPQLWFRNTWAWGRDQRTPTLEVTDGGEAGCVVLRTEHAFLGRYTLVGEGAPAVLVCDNETNTQALYGVPGRSAHPRDAVDAAVVHADSSALSPDGRGTKAALHYQWEQVAPGQTVQVRLRFTAGAPPACPANAAFDDFGAVLDQRRAEADDFYAAVLPAAADDVDRDVARRAFAGLLWGKQIYRYSVREWLEGDPAGPQAPPQRQAGEPSGRNVSWRHLELADVLSVPDDWEYPWFAAWDLAFHAVTLAHIDPAFAKDQLLLMCREWAQHPNGQMPAYEWSFSDVNPPVHAWAAWQVYEIDGRTDRAFLTAIATKLLLNFGWWVNRKDPTGSDLFEGGFMGMDNISVFDRSRQVPPGKRLEQSDATSWMAFFVLSMLRIAQELARQEPAWDDLATTFLERFVAITVAAEAFGSQQVSLWDESDGFFYDVLVGDDSTVEPVRVRSLVGLIPLLAVTHVPDWVARELPDYVQRRAWLERHRAAQMAAARFSAPDRPGDETLTLVQPDRYRRVLARMLDEREFLSPHGLRSLSAAYRDGESIQVAGETLPIRYCPGPSDTNLFGGNSNWRGPVWLPVNVLLVDALRTYARGAGGELTFEYPTGSGASHALPEIADDLRERLLGLFRPGPDGRRPSDPRDHGLGPLWEPHPTFSEYFHGDTGEGLGASHQTGWTALVAHLVCVKNRQQDHSTGDRR